MAGTVEVGDRAPDFTLFRNPQKETVTLSDALKERKVVLVFYVLDFASP